MRLAAVVAIVLLASTAAAQGKQTLAFKPAPGSTHRLRATIELITTQEAQGAQSTVNNRTIYDTKYEVKSADANGTTLAGTIESLLIRVESPTGTAVWDSAKEKGGAPPALKPYAIVPGAAFTAVVAPDGSVKSVAGMKEHAAKSFESIADADERDRMSQTIDYHFGEHALKALIETQTHIMPPGPVGPGDEWTTQYDSLGQIPGKVTMKMKLLGINEGVANIMVSQKVEPLAEQPVIRIGGMEARVAVTGGAEGLYRVRVSDGIAQFSSLALQYEGTMRVNANGQETDVPVRLSGSSSFNLL